MNDQGKYEIAFSQNPNTDDACRRYRLIRTPSRGSLGFVVLSDDYEGVPTHWHRGRTRPHMAADCEGCKANTPLRWHGYLAIQGTKSGEICIFEFTEAARAAVVEYKRLHGSLRGAACLCSRSGPRDNAPVVLKMSPSIAPQITLAKCPDVRKYLKRLWEIPDVTDASAPTDQKSNARFDASDLVANAAAKVATNGKHLTSNPK